MLINGFSQDTLWTDDEQERLRMRLLSLLADQTHRFNGWDNTSVTEEQAHELFESALFTLSVVIAQGRAGKRAILSGDLHEVLKAGQSILRRGAAGARLEWMMLCSSPPGHVTAFYEDTVAAIGEFLDRYDVEFAAHRYPAGIDHPLLCPVPERLLGVLYVREYMRRLRAENDLVKRFDPGAVRALYECSVPGWREAPFSLADPVLTNAIGRAMLGEDPRPLSVTLPMREELTRRLTASSAEETHSLVLSAAAEMCAQLGLQADAAYWQQAALALAPRLKQAAAQGDLSLMFFSVTA